MPALARGQASNCANPILDVFTSVNGVLTDVAVLEFQIFDVSDSAKQLVPVQVYPATVGTRASVVVSVLCPSGGKLSTGRFVAAWTPELTEPLGAHQIRWFFKLTSGSPEQTYREEFEVLPEATAGSDYGYCFVSDLRAEGVTVAQATDTQLLALIARASRFVDKCTGRFFDPRTRSYLLDGRNVPTLFFDQPIIAVASVIENGEAVDPTAFVVYNRHISQQLLAPDDRENPKIEFTTPDDWPTWTTSGSRRRWREGQQNVQVEGVFGYTDPNPPSSTGMTPELIRRVTQMLVFRDLPLLSNVEDRHDRANRYRLNSERTRDQSYSLGPGRAEIMAQRGGTTPWTGDPEIDSILDLYRAPPVIRVP